MAPVEANTDARRRSASRPAADSKADAIVLLLLDVAQCFFRIRALGQKAGLITSWGGGAYGFMRSLALLGPLTVPQIAQMRAALLAAGALGALMSGSGPTVFGVARSYEQARQIRGRVARGSWECWAVRTLTGPAVRLVANGARRG